MSMRCVVVTSSGVSPLVRISPLPPAGLLAAVMALISEGGRTESNTLSKVDMRRDTCDQEV